MAGEADADRDRPTPPATDFDPRYFEGRDDHDEQDLLTTVIARRRLTAVLSRTAAELDEARSAGDAAAEAALDERVRQLRESLERLGDDEAP